MRFTDPNAILRIPGNEWSELIQIADESWRSPDVRFYVDSVFDAFDQLTHALVILEAVDIEHRGLRCGGVEVSPALKRIVSDPYREMNYAKELLEMAEAQRDSAHYIMDEDGDVDVFYIDDNVRYFNNPDELVHSPKHYEYNMLSKIAEGYYDEYRDVLGIENTEHALRFTMGCYQTLIAAINLDESGEVTHYIGNIDDGIPHRIFDLMVNEPEKMRELVRTIRDVASAQLF